MTATLYDRRWREVRARVLASARVCAICGEPIDFMAAPRSRWAPSVDHLLPISMTRDLDPSLRRRLALDPSGLVPVHVRCNSQRGNGTRPRSRRVSRRWE